MAAVKADWAKTLAGMQAPDREHVLRYGIEHLPSDRPPNAAQFKAICNRAPETKPLVLRAPDAAPERVQQVREKLAELAAPKDPRAWARRLAERHESERLSLAQIDMYRSTLAARYGEMGVTSLEMAS
jgi:hypothetical protein